MAKVRNFTFIYLLQNIVDKEPIGDIEERIREQAVEYSYEVSFVAPEAKILVVDDNQVNRKVFCNLLKELQMEIHEAAGGFACLDMVTKQSYDLIFLDHMMPDLDGVETIKKMHTLDNNLCKGTPVIALTANALSGAKEMYLDIGFSDYLSKPFRPEKLEDFSKKLIIEPIKALTDIFLEEWLSYEERLSVFKVNEGNMENEKKFSASVILDFLSPLDAAMEDMDVDTADEIIKQIQCYEMPDNLKELTEQLASAVMNLDIQMEHKIVKKLREEMKTT